MSTNQAEQLYTQITLLDEKASIPKRANSSDTGYDLKFIGIKEIIGDVIFFKTGIAIAPPEGYYYEVVPRSSLSKLPLEMANSIGIIDEHYRGEILVPVRVTHQFMGQDQGRAAFPQGVVKIFGVSPATLTDVANQILIKKPNLFQLILRKREDSEFVVVDKLSETARGDGGFGSTDKGPVKVIASKRKQAKTAEDEQE